MGLCPQPSQPVGGDIPAWCAKWPGRSQPRAFHRTRELVVILILFRYGSGVDRFGPAHVFRKALCFVMLVGEIHQLIYVPIFKL